nr:hypothetical protein [Tanacetum cinerariifolium]
MKPFSVNQRMKIIAMSKILATILILLILTNPNPHSCHPMNQDSYNSNSLGFDQPQPPQSSVIHPPPQELSIQEMEDLKQQSPSTSLNYLLEETNTFDNSLPEFETFCFDVEEISSGSPTTYSDSSLYASFIFDLSINLVPPADGSDSYEFTDELIPFISAPEYDCFLFKVEPNSRDFTKDVVEDISPTKEPQVLNTLPTHPILQLNMKFQPSSESLFAYVVWIFLPYLVYSVVPCYLLSLRTEDIIFDPGICKYHFSHPNIYHRYETVKKFNTHRSHLNTFPMLINGQINPLLDVLLLYFYPP